MSLRWELIRDVFGCSIYVLVRESDDLPEPPLSPPGYEDVYY